MLKELKKKKQKVVTTLNNRPNRSPLLIRALAAPPFPPIPPGMQAGTFLEVLNMLKTYIAAVFAYERVIAEHVARKINGCYLPASDNTDLSAMVSALCAQQGIPC
jgi:hypothetical protein